MESADIFKIVSAFLLTGLSGVTGWLAHSVLNSRENIVLLKEKVERLEAKAKEQLSVDTVREVMDACLERHDRAIEKRRIEWERLHRLEVEKAISNQLHRLVPRLVREIRESRGRDT